jgi:hypothetical protein
LLCMIFSTFFFSDYIRALGEDFKPDELESNESVRLRVGCDRATKRAPGKNNHKIGS